MLMSTCVHYNVEVGLWSDQQSDNCQRTEEEWNCMYHSAEVYCSLPRGVQVVRKIVQVVGAYWRHIYVCIGVWRYIMV